MNFYNEIDKYAAQWLRNLIEAGHIPPGVVDERDIRDIHPDELVGYIGVHFFAGIGGWPYALRLAGWPDDKPVWTGSCPCQPFSTAGKRKGFADERHLWPTFANLIAVCKPSVVFGEQVSAKAIDPWIDLVHANMETMGYAFGCVPFPSAGVGAPHIRDRCYWVGVGLADSNSDGLQGSAVKELRGSRWRQEGDETGRSRASLAGRLADSDRTGSARHGTVGWNSAAASWIRGGLADSSKPNWLAYRDFDRREAWREIQPVRQESDIEHGEPISSVADTSNQQFSDTGRIVCVDKASSEWKQSADTVAGLRCDNGPSQTNGYWCDADWLGCRDNKWRPIEPGLKPLVDGLSKGMGSVRANQERIATFPREDQGSRVGRLKGYGNAINPHAAAEFIKAFNETGI